jgi:hypothetical protein
VPGSSVGRLLEEGVRIMAGEFSMGQLTSAVAQWEAGIVQEASDWGREGEAQMRADAPWTDRGGIDSVTGKTARESLEVEAGQMGNGDIQVVFRSTRESTHLWRGMLAPVGAFLELGTIYMGKRAVIFPTLEARAGELQSRLEAVLRPDI